MGRKTGRFTKALYEGASRVGEEDVRDVAGEGRVVEEKLRSMPVPLVERIGDRIRLFLSAAQDYASGEYRQMSWATIAMVVFAIIYFINPADIFPDVIPISGYIDDAGLIAAALGLLGHDLDRYAQWKKAKEQE